MRRLRLSLSPSFDPCISINSNNSGSSRSRRRKAAVAEERSSGCSSQAGDQETEEAGRRGITHHPSGRVSVNPNCGSVATEILIPVSPLPSGVTTLPRITDTRLLRRLSMAHPATIESRAAADPSSRGVHVRGRKGKRDGKRGRSEEATASWKAVHSTFC